MTNPIAGSTNGTSPAPMYPPVRRLRFRFGEPKPMNRHFVEGDIVLSHLVAVLSGAFPPGEESFIRSVRRFSDQVTDPELKKRVAGFIGQESVHGQEHRRLNEKLIAMGYRYVRVYTFPKDSRRQRIVERIERALPGYVHLAATAAAEHYTATLAERVLSSEQVQAIPGDPEVWHLLNWHAVEELEHKSVAFDVYRAVGGPEWIRIAVMAVIYALTVPMVTMEVLASMATDRTAWRPITVARQLHELYTGPLAKGMLAKLRVYLRPGFHPDDVDTDALVQRWREQLFSADGELVGHLQ